MKKMFTLAFILALAAVCPVVATETTETDLEALMAELNDSVEEETVAPAAEEPVANVATDVQEEK